MSALAAAPSAVDAQYPTMVRVTATVRSSAGTESSELVFGTMRPGAQYVVEPRPDSPAGTAGIVVLDLTTAEVYVTVPARMTLQGPHGPIDAMLRCAHSVAPVATSAPRPFACDRGQPLLIQTNGHERRLIYVGGVIDAESARRVAPGFYRGALRVTASFTTF